MDATGKKVREEISQDKTKDKEIKSVYVITGTIFSEDPEELESGILIPSYCYKIIAYQRGYRGTIKAIAFIFPQEPVSEESMDYAVTIDEIENKTGIDFFPELSSTKSVILKV